MKTKRKRKIKKIRKTRKTKRTIKTMKKMKTRKIRKKIKTRSLFFNTSNCNFEMCQHGKGYIHTLFLSERSKLNPVECEA